MASEIFPPVTPAERIRWDHEYNTVLLNEARTMLPSVFSVVRLTHDRAKVEWKGGSLTMSISSLKHFAKSAAQKTFTARK